MQNCCIGGKERVLAIIMVNLHRMFTVLAESRAPKIAWGTVHSPERHKHRKPVFPWNWQGPMAMRIPRANLNEGLDGDERARLNVWNGGKAAILKGYAFDSQNNLLREEGMENATLLTGTRPGRLALTETLIQYMACSRFLSDNWASQQERKRRRWFS